MKKMICLLACLLTAGALASLCGCSMQPDLTDYVSEYRSHIYEGTQDSYTVFASFTRREYPYEADGNVGNMQDLFEIALTVSDNTKTYGVSFSVGGKNYEADLSYNSVDMTHECSMTIPEPTETSINFVISEEGTESSVSITATDQRGEGTLELAPLLQRVQSAEDEKFAALTDGRTFAGELYVRLLCENENRYFYIGLTDRSGSTYAMLADAVTGEIVATRE